MHMYYIYHIEGIKIGVTSQIEKRMRDQGFTNWDILEEHTDIYEVSDREIELQKEYGYKVDNIPYWKAVQNRYKFNSQTAREASRKGIRTSERQSHAGKAGGRAKRSLTADQVKSIRLERFNEGTAMKQLGAKYNVSKGVIFKILHNKSYTDPEFLI